MFDKGIIHDASGLGYTIHAFSDFDIYKAIVDEAGELVLFHDGGWNDSDWNPHVLVGVHGCVQVEVFQVHAHHFGVRCGENTVD